MAKILKKSQGLISKVKCFCWPKINSTYYYIQNVEDGIQIQVYKINKG